MHLLPMPMIKLITNSTSNVVKFIANNINTLLVISGMYTYMYRYISIVKIQSCPLISKIKHIYIS